MLRNPTCQHKLFISYRFLKVAALCLIDSTASPSPEMVSPYRCALSGFICGISYTLNGVENIRCVVQNSDWCTADSPI